MDASPYVSRLSSPNRLIRNLGAGMWALISTVRLTIVTTDSAPLGQFDIQGVLPSLVQGFSDRSPPRQKYDRRAGHKTILDHGSIFKGLDDI
ncbi:hypothetical protein PAAG_06340 [Paracoccidioides lutzii Pb01]|uniref:Uncharacterized protein n=1 Tax=Paracoccidioides lutzii (strain ATCC MYA-826 / Pb01) TaxID=502779 RepID=C1H6E9_PARBA|nr:hypothetical protein PAAG_06340 [Paracoccidioides lutzii Pb01]EEH35293.2 hypothetical protein PAAG_06340 [Paracoccidioides lutzii Pb01]